VSASALAAGEIAGADGTGAAAAGARGAVAGARGTMAAGGGCDGGCRRDGLDLANRRHRLDGNRWDSDHRLLGGGRRDRHLGRGPGTLLDGADRLPDADHRSLRGDDLAEDAVGGGGISALTLSLATSAIDS